MSGRRPPAKPSARARRQKARTAAKRRHDQAAERERLAAFVELAIARLDEIDGDVDFEAGSDDELTNDAEDFREDDEDSGGEDLSRGYGYPPGNEDDAELDHDNEPSHNAPVSETLLGHALLVPQAMPVEELLVPPAGRVAPPEPPEGYAAIKVLQ